jgi:hypothetical protein
MKVDNVSDDEMYTDDGELVDYNDEEVKGST